MMRWWVIEAPGPRFLATRTIGGRSEFYWMRDEPDKSPLIFETKEQAFELEAAVRNLTPDLWAFAANLGDAWPVEYLFDKEKMEMKVEAG